MSSENQRAARITPETRAQGVLNDAQQASARQETHTCALVAAPAAVTLLVLEPPLRTGAVSITPKAGYASAQQIICCALSARWVCTMDSSCAFCLGGQRALPTLLFKHVRDGARYAQMHKLRSARACRRLCGPSTNEAHARASGLVCSELIRRAPPSRLCAYMMTVRTEVRGTPCHGGTNSSALDGAHASFSLETRRPSPARAWNTPYAVKNEGALAIPPAVPPYPIEPRREAGKAHLCADRDVLAETVSDELADVTARPAVDAPQAPASDHDASASPDAMGSCWGPSISLHKNVIVWTTFVNVSSRCRGRQTAHRHANRIDPPRAFNDTRRTHHHHSALAQSLSHPGQTPATGRAWRHGA
ncbi:hypothetical protein HYPSUDRAFT_207928 [Hypholoma sublateritium FD-334 SS-4]|uniref:Uncharacterized protein n=1 Tax=Hypholoma sublateritium (strain FD-334 SS-4) TaxID=945553 RepID=A0A0D2LWY3_HYPSF|nr:hypothetical protein HYPSUDRAFT_207928 [Hypholoma sublateritium FD-334 SS-4]